MEQRIVSAVGPASPQAVRSAADGKTDTARIVRFMIDLLLDGAWRAR
jgi:hypothetical protein